MMEKSKRRSWGKRCKSKMISIDDVDVSMLTSERNLDDKNQLAYIPDDLVNPDLLPNETLNYHLTRMKFLQTDLKLSRQELLCLFRIHVCPKPQRNCRWRREKRRESLARDTCWVETTKRENTNAQLAPDSKRIHLEDQTTKPLSIDQDVQKDGISSRRIIKIKRKCKNESIFTQETTCLKQPEATTHTVQ